MNNMWNVILYGLSENKLADTKNNPTKSGRYLCTCVRKRMVSEEIKVEKYLQVMQYNAEQKCWHDCDYNTNVFSHNILAWTDVIELCDFDDFELLPGGYLVEKKFIEEKEDAKIVRKCKLCGKDTGDKRVGVCDKCASEYKF